MCGYVHRTTSVPLLPRAKELAPQAKPLSLEREPPEKQAGGSETRPYDISGKIQQKQRAHTQRPYGVQAGHSKNRRPAGAASFILPCRKTTSESPATARPR